MTWKEFFRSGGLLTGLLSLLLPACSRAELNFQTVILDPDYFAYERDVGDIDGDGDNDVVGIQEGDTNLQVFRAPSWARSILISFTGTNRYPRTDDLKLADINGDGKLDFVTRLGVGPSDNGPGLAVWYENLGGGSNFTEHVLGTSPEYVKDIVVLDLDRDGRLDVAMRMDSQTQLWLQNADGSWSEVLFSHPPHEGMEACDLDMDGDPDLIMNGFWFPTPDTPAAARVATNYTRRDIDVSWFNQNGDWRANSCKVVAGDFDGDGTNDVAFSHSELTGYAVAWYKSSAPNGEGPWIKHSVAVVDYCHNLQAADWDLDGDVDLLVGGMIQSEHRGLKWMLNDGSGTNWSELVIQSAGSYSAELGDIDKDGDLDIVGIHNWDAGPTYIYRNNAGGGPSLDFWFYKQVSSEHVRTFGLCSPDVDGDGDLDIASGPFVYLNPGSPMTNTWTQIPLPESVHAFATLDVNSNSLADVIAQKDNGVNNRIDIYWVEAVDVAGTSWGSPVRIGDVPRSLSYQHPEGVQGYAVAELVAGGKPEIVVNSPQGLYYFTVPTTNPGAGSWPRTFIAPNNSEEGIGVADIDGDGDLDISFTHGDPHEVKWGRNPGDGSGDWDVFTIGTFPEANWPDQCAAADLNGDGRVDIVVTEENDGSAADALAVWWEQPAEGATNANWVRRTIATQYTMNSLDVGDVDMDGDLDLVLAEHRGSKKIAVWQNDGTGTFSEKRVGMGQESHLGGRLADLDGDGDLDLVSIAYDDYTKLHLWRNDSPPKLPPGPPLLIKRAAFFYQRAEILLTLAAGHTYAVMFRDSLFTGAWQTLVEISLPAVSSAMSVTDSILGQPHRFYQLTNLEGLGNSQSFDGVEIVRTKLNLHFQAAAGASYEVVYRDSLTVGSWAVLTNFTTAPMLTNALATDLGAGNSERFYRVQTLSPNGMPAIIEGVELRPTSFDLFFDTVAGASYTVEYAGQSTAGAWQVLTNFHAEESVTDRVVSDSNPSGGGRLYRLKSP